ncbi:MAG: hypothetical protein ACO1OB_09380 [Archangium sp.]
MKFLFVVALLSSTAFAEAWEWSRIPTSGGPVARRHPGLAYDPVRKLTVVFGGMVKKDLACLGDTWTFDGKKWSRAGNGPPSRAKPALAFDATRGRVLLFGGTCGQQYFNDLWEFDGRAWTEVKTDKRSDAGLTSAFVHDPSSGSMVLILRDDRIRAEVWRLRGDAWSLDVTPRGCSLPILVSALTWADTGRGVSFLQTVPNQGLAVTPLSTCETEQRPGFTERRSLLTWVATSTQPLGLDPQQLGSGWDATPAARTFKNPPAPRLASAFAWESNRLLMFGGHLVGKASVPGMALGEFTNELWALSFVTR